MKNPIATKMAPPIINGHPAPDSMLSSTEFVALPINVLELPFVPSDRMNIPPTIKPKPTMIIRKGIKLPLANLFNPSFAYCLSISSLATRELTKLDANKNCEELTSS